MVYHLCRCSLVNFHIVFDSLHMITSLGRIEWTQLFNFWPKKFPFPDALFLKNRQLKLWLYFVLGYFDWTDWLEVWLQVVFHLEKRQHFSLSATTCQSVLFQQQLKHFRLIILSQSSFWKCNLTLIFEIFENNFPRINKLFQVLSQAKCMKGIFG